jgi:hypothetical protein
MNSLTYNKIKTNEELDLTSANTDKAFEYFEKVQEDKLYVVCHSHIMQHIIEEIYNVEKKKKFGLFGGGTSSENQNKSVKCTKGTANKMSNFHTFKDFFKNITDENMWDFDIDYQNQNENKKKNITFVRHAFSVANIYNERAKKNILGPASKNKRDQLREKDAKLSLFGILSAVKMSEKKKYKLKDQQNVYVSCLIRTWMTAICLFLPNMSDGGTLTLIVTPGIKEKGGTDDNVPDPIHVQIQTIRYFYTFLIDLILPNKNIKNTKIVIKIGNNEIPISTNNSNKQGISNIYNKGWKAKNTTLIDYLKKNIELVDKGFIGCVKNGVNRFKNVTIQLNKFNKNKKEQNTNTNTITVKKTSKYIIKRIANGFPKPNTLQKNIFNKNNSIFRISRWKEPFSIKSDKYIISGRDSSNKIEYQRRQLNNTLATGGKKQVKKTTVKKTTTTKKPVKKTTTKKPVKKTTTKKK